MSELIAKTGWHNLSVEESNDKEVTGVFVGDLLSWVMGKGEPNQAWITVQSHLNVVAVAVLIDFGCLIIAESIEVSDEVLEKAKEEKIAVLSASESSFECAKKLVELGF